MEHLWQQIAALVVALAVLVWVRLTRGLLPLPLTYTARRIQSLQQRVAELEARLEAGSVQAREEATRQLQTQNQQLREDRARVVVENADLRDRVAELEDEVAAAHGVEVDVVLGMPG